MRERMVSQRTSDKHYLPGPLIFELSLALPGYARFQAASREPLTELSKRLRAQAILYLRSDMDWVCAAFAGETVYAGGALEVGMRRPLAFSAGGAAILIAIPRDEARAIIEKNLTYAARMGDLAAQRLRLMLRRSAALGYALNRGETTKGVHSFGVPLRCTKDGDQVVFGSIAVAGHAKDFPSSRTAGVIAAMRCAATILEQAAVVHLKLEIGRAH